jgi:hypothetical protein
MLLVFFVVSSFFFCFAKVFFTTKAQRARRKNASHFYNKTVSFLNRKFTGLTLLQYNSESTNMTYFYFFY